MIALTITRITPAGTQWPEDYGDNIHVFRHSKESLGAEWYQIRFSSDGSSRLKLITVDSWQSLNAYLDDPIILKDMFIKNRQILALGGTITYAVEEVFDWSGFVSKMLVSHPNDKHGNICDDIPVQDL